MDSKATLEGVFRHFQDMALPPGRSQELVNELRSVNAPVRELYDRVADFDAQPMDFQRALLELRRRN